MSVASREQNSATSYTVIEDAPVAKFLFGDIRLSWFWLIIRLYVGYEWLIAGYEKIINPVWVGAKAGTALTGFIQGALKLTAGAHPSVQSWYGSFLQNAVLPNLTLFSSQINIFLMKEELFIQMMRQY